MNTLTLDSVHSQFTLPAEVFAAMGRPHKLTIVPESLDHFFLSAQSARVKDRLYYLKEAILAKVSKAHKQARTAVLIAADNVGARYSCDHSVGFRSREYHIVNYHPTYYLMSTNPVPEDKSREEEWKHIKSYHEHLRLAAQDQNARDTSRWFAEDVIKPLAPGRVLELGCGSGRNLHHILIAVPDASVTGLDINEDAIATAQKEFAGQNAKFVAGSIYSLDGFGDRSIDVVLTAGVLMHIPHERVGSVVREMHRIARKAVVHFELHGPSHKFDFHRYPRDYAELYRSLGLLIASYDVYPRGDFRSLGTASFNHALLVSRKD